MKKIITIICILLIITGCKKEEITNTMECKINTEAQGIKLEGNYEINYTENFVNTVKFIETYTVENENLVTSAEETFDNLYSKPSELEHYDYTRTTDGLNITSTVTIDYTKLDIEKLIEINDSIKEGVKNGKVDAKTLINSYKSNGATCQEK